MKLFIHLIAIIIASISVSISLSACQSAKTEYASGSSFVSNIADKDRMPIIYPSNNPSISDGREVWEKNNCASCHGDDGSGVDSFVQGGSQKDLTDEYFMYRRTPTAIYNALMYGLPKKGHPKIGDESPQKIWSLVFFVRSLGCPPFTEKQLAEVEPFFSANCAGCHGPQGFGDGKLAQGLDPRPANFHQYNRLFDRQDYMLFNHIGDGLYPAAMPPWRGYKDPHLKIDVDNRYIKKLVQYVRHFHVDSGDKPLAWWEESKNGKEPIIDEQDHRRQQLEKGCCP